MQKSENDNATEVGATAGWVRPGDVMLMRKLRNKRHALQARMSCSSNPLVRSQQSNMDSHQQHQSIVRNPFRRSPIKKVRRRNGNSNSSSSRSSSYQSHNSELSSDATLFNLLHNTDQQQLNNAILRNYSNAYTFSEALRQQGIPPKKSVEPVILWMDSLVVDWSLKSKIRFISDSPIPWRHNFKTSEEASGTTGMARCLWGDGSSSKSDLDTSPNAEFFQRCLVWQHPSLPGVSLFPRDGIKAGMTTSSAAAGRTASMTGPYADPLLSSNLQASWCESLRSLHQLLRVRQCPYFYVCAPSFTVLYRAAGVCSIPHAHAFVTPTTRGLRAAMKEDGIEFEMPLNKQQHSSPPSSDSKVTSDYSSSGSYSSTTTSPSAASSCGSASELNQLHDNELDGDNPADSEEAAIFLANLGVDTTQFANLNPNRKKMSSTEIDRSPLSLVYIADPDTQGLTNFLLNSPSCISVTGALAGVPPTLLAPVAFQGGTLLPFKMKGGSVRVRGKQQYSMEMTGPVMPHTSLQLCQLLAQHVDSYTLHATPLTHTLSFSNCTAERINVDKMTKAFAEEGLVDCGLNASVRSSVCQPLQSSKRSSLRPESSSYQPCKDSSSDIIDSEELAVISLPPSYRFITYKDAQYTWSDQHNAES
uniref:Protein downstream neighbor of son homolog n=1 Tax=Hirondellea gigas TaxID=1518452 RepID=A0A2P2I4G9_9CRUS